MVLYYIPHGNSNKEEKMKFEFNTKSMVLLGLLTAVVAVFPFNLQSALSQ